jgi:hypothetical protein
MRGWAILPVLLVSQAAAADWIPDHLRPSDEKATDSFSPVIRPIQIVNGAALAAAGTLIAADYFWSIEHISTPRQRRDVETGRLVTFYDKVEGDPIVVALFGKHPSTEQFAGLALFSVTATTAVWCLLPENYKWIAPAVVIGVEGGVMVHNLSLRITF